MRGEEEVRANRSVPSYLTLTPLKAGCRSSCGLSQHFEIDGVARGGPAAEGRQDIALQEHSSAQ